MNLISPVKKIVPAALLFALAGTALFAKTDPQSLVHQNYSREQIAAMSPEELKKLEFKTSMREYPRIVVDGKLLTEDDLRAEISRAVLALRREAKSSEEYVQKYNQLVGETLSRYTEMYLFVGEYESGGMQIPEDYIDSRVNERIERDFGGDRGQYLDYLRKIGSNPIAERKRLKNMIIENNMNWLILQDLPEEISPMDVFRDYHKQSKNFIHPESVEYSQIVIYAGAGEGDDSVERAAKALNGMLKKNPENFAGTAKIHSRDEFRGNGGYVGWVPLENLSDAVIETLEATKPGQVSDLLELTDGSGRRMFIIFKLIDRRAAGMTPLNDVRPMLENAIRGSEQQKARAEYLENLRQKFNVEWF